MEYLIYSAILGLIHIFAAAAASTRQRGLKWNLSARDETLPPLSALGSRLDRASKNFFETFPIFVAAMVAVLVQNRPSPEIEHAAQLYFFARVIYLPLYAFGVPLIRTIVWGASIVGIIWLLVTGL